MLKPPSAADIYVYTITKFGEVVIFHNANSAELMTHVYWSL